MLHSSFDSLPKSRSDALDSGVRLYFTGKKCKNGHLTPRDVKHGCKGCRKEKKRTPGYIAGKRLAKRRWDKTPQGRASKAKQKARRLERIKADPVAYEAYRAKKREQKRRYLQTPGGILSRRRRDLAKEERIRRATPPWCDRSALNAFIDGCPPDHHLDHIIPLRGKNICGLHVIGNLQYLPSRENIAKSNKVDPLTLEANVCVLPQYRSYVRE